MSFMKKFFLGVLAALLLGGAVWGIKEAGLPGGEPPAGAVTPTLVQEKGLKFAVMADIHLDEESFSKALTKAKNDGAEFVIIAGDLTSLGKKNELESMKEVLEQGGLPYYVVPGNHDLWFSEQTKENFFQEVFGQEYQSFKKDKIKFILVNDGSYAGLEGVAGVGDPDQKTWLENEVTECSQVTCLVFAHMPFNHPTSAHIYGEDNEAASKEAKEVVKLLVDNSIERVFAGHLHFSSSYEIDGLKTTIVGAVTRDRNLQSPKFLEVEEKGGKLAEKEIFVAN